MQLTAEKIKYANDWKAGSSMKKPSYKKLWKLLIDRDLKKKDLQGFAGISSATIVKLSNHENVSMDILLKVCDALQVDVCDIVEFLDSSDDV